uniref:Tetratricopeptide repeat protein n=1 Tax=Desulfobacca acetoxidans TaxID=60893 RepID=A0A7C3V3W9_9BACT
MQSAGRFMLALLLVASVLCGSQCARKREALKIRPVTMKEAAKIQDAYDSVSAKSEPGGKEELSPERREALGDLLLEKQQYDGSLLHYLQVLKDNPERYDIRYKVGVILLLSGQAPAARQEFNTVLAAKPEMLEAKEALGLTYLEEKQYPQAVRIFQEVLNQDRSRAKTRHLLGIAYLAQENPREAIRVMEPAVARDDRNVALLATLGQAYVKVKDYRQALFYLKKGHALDPKDKKINLNMGLALAGLKQYSEAFEAFRQAGDEAQAYNNIGVHYYLEGHYEDAAKCFQKALELRPTFYEEAKTNLERALEKLQHNGKEAI